mgnify:CR=1 FL=1
MTTPTTPAPKSPVPSIDENDKSLLWSLFEGLTVGGAAPDRKTGEMAVKLLDEVDAIVAKLTRDEKAKESKRDFLERKEDVRDELVGTVQRLLEQGTAPSGVVAKADAIHEAYENIFEGDEEEDAGGEDDDDDDDNGDDDDDDDQDDG